MTQQQILLKALTARGWTVNPRSHTQRYVCLTKEDANGNLYVGKAGALRFGPTVAASVPCDGFKRQMLAEGSRG